MKIGDEPLIDQHARRAALSGAPDERQFHLSLTVPPWRRCLSRGERGHQGGYVHGEPPLADAQTAMQLSALQALIWRRDPNVMRLNRADSRPKTVCEQ
jgi:hypothetical protein